MKYLLAALTFLLSLSAFAIEYPVKNYNYISDFDYRTEVSSSDKFNVLIFSSKECLERVVVSRECFQFERKLDYMIPKFSTKLKFIGFNTYFENYTVSSEFQITKSPTVIILKNNQIIKRFEPVYRPYNPQLPQGQIWYDSMFTDVVNTLNQIR